MKELSIEGNAYDGNYKAYTELINRLEGVKDAIKKQNYGIAMDILYKPYPEYQITASPELKESDDEKIRKAIGYAIGQSTHSDGTLINGVSSEEALSWLEKQGEQKTVDEIAKEVCKNKISAIAFLKSAGIINEKGELSEQYRQEGQKSAEEYNITSIRSKNAQGKLGEMIKNLKPINEVLEQNPADKIEPKFKVGDWVIDKQGLVHQITNVIENVICHTYAYDIVGGGYFNDNTEGVRLWTIKDAKDGDVLFTSSTASHETFIFKNIDEKGNAKCYFAYDSEDGFREGKYHFIGRATDCKPATKEQRDQLEKAMADAGYTFDFERKELKKIEQKPTWSEEDEEIHRKCICAMRASACGFPEEEKFVEQVDNWLKSLKDRVQSQPKQEWSEEDEKMYNVVHNLAWESYKTSRRLDIPTFGIINDWLKSLRAQNTWKPSDEQMEALDNALSLAKNCGEESAFDLRTLYEHLKKLREK